MMVIDEMIFFKDGRNSWVKPKDNRNCHRIIEKVIGKIIFNEAGILSELLQNQIDDH